MKNYYIKTLSSLEKLKSTFPQYTLGRHISTILDDVGDVWGMTDKEFYDVTTHYIKNLSLDVPHEEKEIEQIIKESLYLDVWSLKEDNDYFEE